MLLYLETSLIVSTYSCLTCMWQKTYKILKINFSVVESDGHVLGNGFVRRGEQSVTSHKTMNLSLDSQLMYYVHNVFTQYVILLDIAEKDHNRTEVGVAKTPLETTRLLNPVYIEEFFRKELFLCENRKMLKETLQKHRSRMFLKLHVLKNFGKFTGKNLCLFLINLQASRPYSAYYRTLRGGCCRCLKKD